MLIIEDGTGVADANSYASAAAARAYAALRGVTLPAAPESGQDPVETMLVLAAQYLDGLSWIGKLATFTQGLKWPRVLNRPYLGFKFYPSEWWYYNEGTVDPSYYILPPKLIAAQCQAVLEQSANGVVLQPTSVGGIDSQFVTRERVDVIETTYSEKIGTLTTPTMLTVNALLQGLLVVGGGAGAIRAVRV